MIKAIKGEQIDKGKHVPLTAVPVLINVFLMKNLYSCITYLISACPGENAPKPSPPLVLSCIWRQCD